MAATYKSCKSILMVLLTTNMGQLILDLVLVIAHMIFYSHAKVTNKWSKVTNKWSKVGLYDSHPTCVWLSHPHLTFVLFGQPMGDVVNEKSSICVQLHPIFILQSCSWLHSDFTRLHSDFTRLHSDFTRLHSDFNIVENALGNTEGDIREWAVVLESFRTRSRRLQSQNSPYFCSGLTLPSTAKEN